MRLRFVSVQPDQETSIAGKPGKSFSLSSPSRSGSRLAAEDTRLQDAASLVVPASPAFSNAMGAARPNPTAGGAVIAYSLAAPGQAELSIYDVSGRRIQTVLSADRPMGAHEVQWDGRDALAGAPCRRASTSIGSKSARGGASAS